MFIFLYSIAGCVIDWRPVQDVSCQILKIPVTLDPEAASILHQNCWTAEQLSEALFLCVQPSPGETAWKCAAKYLNNITSPPWPAPPLSVAIPHTQTFLISTWSDNTSYELVLSEHNLILTHCWISLLGCWCLSCSRDSRVQRACHCC